MNFSKKNHELQKNNRKRVSKQVITLLTVLLISFSSFAQQGINYKAILKDTNGNLLAGTFMNVQFTIYEDTATGTIVYQEDHNYTTDANGLLIHNIGSEASPSVGVFADIDWATYQHFLQVTIAYSGGTINFDATEFMAVPYAKHAETSANAFSGNYNDLSNQPTITEPSGLEEITENGVEGWRLKGREPSNYGNIGLDAIDLSYSSNNSSTYGATGNYATAMGRFTVASGTESTAMGFGNTASGVSSTAMGENTTASGGKSTTMGEYTSASGDWSTAMGYATAASGSASTAMGYSTTSKSYAETTIGSFNSDYTPNNSDFWDINDRLFVIGNGTSNSSRSDALIVLKNGTIRAPSFDLSEITNHRALITKEYADAYLSNSGLESINEQGGPFNSGWALVDRISSAHGPLGDNAIDLTRVNTSSSSSTIGATGSRSISLGYFTTASGSVSTAMGYYTTAASLAETTIGSFNTNYTPDNPFSWGENDRLFVIGNGTSNSSRSNALIVLKDGTTTVNNLSNSNPDLILAGTSNSSDNGIISSDPQYSSSDVFIRSNDEVIFYLDNDNNEDASFSIVNGSGSEVFKVSESGGVLQNGSTIHSSDRRLKTDISILPYGLKEILQLQPKAYYWKDRTQKHKSLGLIAQDVQPIISEIVNTQDDELKTLGISYTELIPILIKALQEQQVIIDAQKAKDVVQDKSIQELIARLNLIESKSSN